jgi:hypothetical protein
MLLPRYSLRWFFYLIILVALLGVIVGQGVQGSRWAIAVACGVASLGATWLVMIAFYAMARLSAAILLPAGAPRQMEAYYPSPAAPRPPVEQSRTREQGSHPPENEQEIPQ